MNVTLEIPQDLIAKIDKKIKEFKNVEEVCPFRLDVDESLLSEKGKKLLGEHRDKVAYRVALQNRSTLFTALITEYFSEHAGS